MVELVRSHGLDEAQFVQMLLKMRQTIGDPMPALTGLVKRILRPHQLRHAGNESKTLPSEQRLRTILTIQLNQLGLVFEKLQLAGSSGHVQVDNPLGARGKLWW